ncbi:MAG: hypothetical protein ACLTV6_06350 [Christensenellales bacterium]
MGEIARWGGHVFEVTPQIVRSLNTLTVKAGIETDDMEADKQRYVARQAGKAAEVSFALPLSGLLGVDVRTEAMTFIDEARQGKQDYFYIGGTKLMTCQLMLTEASVSETEIGAGGVWVGCKVKLTMKQSSKFDGESGEGHKVESGSSTGYEATDEELGRSGSGKKKSVATDTMRKTLASSHPEYFELSLKTAGLTLSKTKNTFSSASADIKRMTNNAKAASRRKLSSTLGKGLIVEDR